MVQKFLKIFKLENFQKNSHSRGMKCQPKANNNREAVVVCARHVVKRPSKRMRASLHLNLDGIVRIDHMEFVIVWILEIRTDLKIISKSIPKSVIHPDPLRILHIYTIKRN